MQGTATPFTADFNMLSALTGKGNIPLPTETPYASAGVTVIDPDVGIFQELTTLAANTTLNTLNVGKPGQLLIISIINDAGGARTITPGANLRAAGNLVGTASKIMQLTLISNGVKWIELSRTIAIT